MSTITVDNWEKYKSEHEVSNTRELEQANWVANGPSSSNGGYSGIGRLNCIAFHPTDPNTFWVGSPSGGLWKTTDGGINWSTNTDDFPVLGVSDIAIDYTNPNIMYLATGDRDLGSLSSATGSPLGDTKSIGVLKSTDGGDTWNYTGLNWDVTSSKIITRLVINPIYPLELTATTSDGIWRTLDGGDTWSQVETGYFIDVEFKPNNSDTLYASTYASNGGAQIYRSTDYGGTWTSVAYSANVTRINLAVSPDWPDLVDALCANTSFGLAALWYSSNSGASFSLYYTGTNTNNHLHASYNASGEGGQGQYDLAYAINPNNSGEIWLGGVNTWRSTDDGSSWSIKTMWNGSPADNPNNVAVVHADKHFFAFHPLQPNTFFECNDGGLYKTTDGGETWTDLSNGLQISQLYRISASQTEPGLVSAGLQDNGSKQFYINQWSDLPTGGDGMETIIDYSNSFIQYTSLQNGKIYRTLDGWVNNGAVISENIPGGQPAGAWVTPYVIDPNNPSSLYAGYKQVYKTTDRGDSWSAISSALTGNDLRSLAVAPSNSSVVYAADFEYLYQTNDGGNNWSLIGFTNDPAASISFICVDPNNSQRVYITKSGYVDGNKVWMTPDGGSNWYNYSGSLPNVPVNCITYQQGTNEGLYVGTDIGVFYTDGSMADWEPYQTGLPNVVVTELEISYSDNRLWAATFGRGLWSSDLFSNPVKVEERETKSHFSVYPNPSNGLFKIRSKDIKIDRYSVFTNDGKPCLSAKNLNADELIIDLAGFPSGLYILEIEGEGHVEVRKLIRK